MVSFIHLLLHFSFAVRGEVRLRLSTDRLFFGFVFDVLLLCLLLLAFLAAAFVRFTRCRGTDTRRMFDFKLTAMKYSFICLYLLDSTILVFTVNNPHINIQKNTKNESTMNSDKIYKSFSIRKD